MYVCSIGLEPYGNNLFPAQHQYETDSATLPIRVADAKVDLIAKEA
jgi:hypothetical protein